MVVKCSNCGMLIITKDQYPTIVQCLDLYYGENYWTDELREISMELCKNCGTLDFFLPYIERNLNKKAAKSYNAVINEITDNQHIPFLLSIGAPILIYLIEEGSKTTKRAAIDALGSYGALDDIGRFVLSNFDVSIRILGIRALQKIEKHAKKRGIPFVWAEFMDIIIDSDLEVIKQIELELPKLGLKPETRAVVEKILGKRRDKLEKRL